MNKIFKFMFFCFALPSLGIKSPAAAENTLQTTLPTKEFNFSITEIDHIVNDALELFHVPGAAIGLVIQDQVLLSRGYGTRNVNEASPITEQTLFPIASCTKAFTAFLLGQLVDEGKIAFDDPVKKYIPEFNLFDPEAAENLSIRDLLAHRSGMARHDPMWVYLEFPRSKVIELLQNLEPACGLRQEFQYNNFMYAIAGIIIERVSGQSWEKALSSRLLKPLKMNDSSTSVKQLEMSPDFSFPHAELNGRVEKIPFRNLEPVNPAGGLNSNIKDMTKWIKLQLNKETFQPNTLIRNETLQEMHAMQISFPFSINASEEIYQLGYGLGWFIGNYRGLDWINHGGDIDGFSSDVSLLPAEGIGLVILTNSSTDGRYVISSIRNQIFDKILLKKNTDWIRKMQEARDKTKLVLQKSLEKFKEITQMNHSIQSLEDYVGTYEHPSYGEIEININGNHLAASFGKMEFPLYFKSENVFTGESSILLAYGVNPLIDFTFIKNHEGEMYHMQVPFEGFRSAKPIIFTKSHQNR